MGPKYDMRLVAISICSQNNRPISNPMSLVGPTERIATANEIPLN